LNPNDDREEGLDIVKRPSCGNKEPECPCKTGGKTRKGGKKVAGIN